MVKIKKVWKWSLIIALVAVTAIVITYIMMDDPRPGGEQGDGAEALAQKMLVAINHDAWENTGAVSWTFAGKRHLIWDKKRQYAKVSWNDREAYIKIDQKTGVAFTNGQQLDGEAAQEIIQKAWEIWVNDAFWLNPVSKIYDPGTSRSLVETAAGDKGLMVEFGSGGSTPGDAYLWEVDAQGLPFQWRMWVSIIPLGGMEATWENWAVTETGVKISTLHKMSGMELKLTDVKTAIDLETLTGSDIFEGKF
jgi:hypothetical protein